MPPTGGAIVPFNCWAINWLTREPPRRHGTPQTLQIAWLAEFTSDALGAEHHRNRARDITPIFIDMLGRTRQPPAA
jgi:hypothetical protein